ncbi:MAG TPA: hypothetical protein VKU02_27645 [Gemmataceae bacterium]|nr:hypothetical protein [Gemmataceae bacterium]
MKFDPACEGKLEKGLAGKVVLYTPSVVNSPGKIERDLGTCRRRFPVHAVEAGIEWKAWVAAAGMEQIGGGRSLAERDRRRHGR